MKLSMKWLEDYVKPGVDIRDYATAMTMSGSKVEGYETEGSEIENVVVGKVLSIEKHPNADTLFICKVEVGAGEPIQIVTGAANVTAGSFVPAALDNSTLPGGKKINSGKLRGETSDGMLCSLGELGLTKHDFPYADEDGIFLLGDDCDLTPGADIRAAIGLGDTVAEFEITPNRPDCLSVIGLARETAATYRIPFALPPVNVKAEGPPVSESLAVEVQNGGLCQRYCAAVVRGVKIAPSPRWLRERLRASGVRPINNIVDITNYVMLEYGHPMHAFDARHVAGNRIVVRNAREGERITTLDGTERRLSPEMLVIADAEKPNAVAGIMGGEFSGVYDDTETVVFESACFDGGSVRLTAKKLGMRTESSSRYEKGLDPAACLPALRRACELVELLGAGTVASGFCDEFPSPREPRRLPFDPDWINRFLGVEIPERDMIAMLESLEFKVESDIAEPPTWRWDAEGAADLAEEVARLYGYDRIPTTALRGSSQGMLTPEQRFARQAEQILLGQGYSEIITYSFVSPRCCDKIRLPADSPRREFVTIQNPLGEDTSVMRTTAIPSMLEALARNYNNRNACARLYEIATEYIPVAGEKLPRERKRIVLGQYSACDNFFSLKAAAELLLERVGLAEWEIEAVRDNPTFHPGRCARILAGGAEIGLLGEIHPIVAENYDVCARILLADLDFEAVFRFAKPEKRYTPLPKYPASTRDLAIVCDESLPASRLQKAIAGTAGSLLETLEIFDVYRGAQIGECKKSVAYALSLRAKDHTLTDGECDCVIEKILAELEALGARLRS